MVKDSLISKMRETVLRGYRYRASGRQLNEKKNSVKIRLKLGQEIV